MKTYRVLFLAMSGVRVKNEELRALGMTLPGFVERGQVIASLPSLGLLTLAAHTLENWECEYREIDELERDAVREILRQDYDLVAISSLTARVLDAYRIADELRREGVTVVIGGLHASALPQEAAAHADAVLQGEGELLWPEMLKDFEAGVLQPLYSSLSKRRRFSLAEARTPRFDLLDVSRYNRLTLQTTRGCPLDCAFCGASRLISPYKVKPIEQVRRELEAILDIWPRPFIELADDNTFVSKAWAGELTSLFADHSIRWFTETDLSVAEDEDLLEALARSGCAQLLVGLESTDTAALGETDSHGWKLRKRDEYIAKIAKIQSYGISVNGCFVLGFDHDDAGVFQRTSEFVRESGLSEVQITILTPFPGTRLYQSLLAEGRLLLTGHWDECTLFDVTYRPKMMTARELEDGFRGLMRDLYSPAASEERRDLRKDVYLKRRPAEPASVAA